MHSATSETGHRWVMMRAVVYVRKTHPRPSLVQMREQGVGERTRRTRCFYTWACVSERRCCMHAILVTFFVFLSLSFCGVVHNVIAFTHCVFSFFLLPSLVVLPRFVSISAFVLCASICIDDIPRHVIIIEIESHEIYQRRLPLPIDLSWSNEKSFNDIATCLE